MRLLLAFLLAVTGFAADKPAFSSAKYDKDIAAFEAADKATPPPQGALLLSGASTLRLWKTAAARFRPDPLINRGFGGSKTTEVLGYMDRITLPYHPRVVVSIAAAMISMPVTPAEAVIGRVTNTIAGSAPKIRTPSSCLLDHSGPFASREMARNEESRRRFPRPRRRPSRHPFRGHQSGA
jgi:hypothetical protein